ncbi:MAG TPA: MurR/RpiR family transcriptional regulator [Clostridiales bacterium]|nr:MurR/RpiR family transcriptional regulator [Clostridiales bacterium]
MGRGVGLNKKSYDLLKEIQDKYREFSKGQRAIAEYIINNYDKAAFMTASKLGEVVNVSESTVVRFAVKLGFEGYPELQKMLQDLIKSKLTSVQRIAVSSSRIDSENILKSVLQSDMDKLKITLDNIDQEEFNNVVQCILNARKIYILGVRSSAALASFLGFYFNLIFDNVRLVHTTSVSEMFEQIVRASEGDVVIGISFPRYSKRTIKAMQFAKDKGCKVIAITDSKKSPISEYADYSLIARSDMASFVDSLVAPLSVINALIVAVGMKKERDVYDIFEKLETIWDEYQVYEKYDDIDITPFD